MRPILLAIWCVLVVMPHTWARADELRPGYIEFSEQAPGAWTLSWKRPYAQPPTEAPPLVMRMWQSSARFSATASAAGSSATGPRNAWVTPM